jgi:hypothetical protein
MIWGRVKVAVEIPSLNVDPKIHHLVRHLIRLSSNMGGNNHRMWLEHNFELNQAIGESPSRGDTFHICSFEEARERVFNDL